MGITLAQMRGQSAQKLEQLRVASQKATSYDKGDEYVPTVDDKGYGFALIRFLPAASTETTEWNSYYKHSFKNEENKQWYIEYCRTTIKGNKDPVTELNSRLYKTGNEADKDQAKRQKRKLYYVSNILVLDDPAKPENNGKVFKFAYGVKIYEKIQNKLTPKFPGEVAFNPFDFDVGANFRLKICNKDNYRNYDMSEFDSQSQLFGGDDAKIEAVWAQCYELLPLTAPSVFKSYEELEKQLVRVLGDYTGADGSVPVLEGGSSTSHQPTTATATRATQQSQRSAPPVNEVKPRFEDVPRSVDTKATAQPVVANLAPDVSNLDDDMAIFNRFAKK